MLTNVYDVTSLIDHDVAIVSVLDLQQVADKGVGSHASDKTAASLQKEKNFSWLHSAHRTLLSLIWCVVKRHKVGNSI